MGNRRNQNPRKNHHSARVTIIVAVVVTVIIFFLLVIIIIAVVAAVFSAMNLRKKKHYKSEHVRDNDKSAYKTESDECQPPGSLYCELATLSSKPAHFTCTENVSTVSTVDTSQLESDLQAGHSDAPMAGSPPESSATNVSVNNGSSKDDSYIEKGPDTSSSPAIIPVYAVPDKLKKKSKKESQNVQEAQDYEEEHIYHVLETDRDTPKLVLSDQNLTMISPDSPSQFSPENPSPVYQDIKEITNKLKESDDSL